LIKFTRDPKADSRVVDNKVDKRTLHISTLKHTNDVYQGLEYLSDLILRAGRAHDHTKLEYLSDFHKAVESGNTRKSAWYKMHIKEERHHLSKPPEDVNLVDVLEHIVDCIMAGTARQENIYDIGISNELLQKAYKNTVELVKSQIVIEEVDHNGNEDTRISG